MKSGIQKMNHQFRVGISKLQDSIRFSKTEGALKLGKSEVQERNQGQLQVRNEGLNLYDTQVKARVDS